MCDNNDNTKFVILENMEKIYKIKEECEFLGIVFHNFLAWKSITSTLSFGYFVN